MRKVIIFQSRLLHYRVTLFEMLREACRQEDIELLVIHGQPSRQEATKKDVGNLSWAIQVKNLFWNVMGKDLVWQPFPKNMRDTELIVVMQESRILSTYPLLLKRSYTNLKVAFWGHAVNCQSKDPSGIREKWKKLLLHKVDWWFAYTQQTVGILQRSNYPRDRITCLNNAIDNNGFKDDLESVSDKDILQLKNKYNLESNTVVGIFCGSLYPEKKLDFLLESADYIQAKTPSFCLFIIGDGPMMDFLQDAAKSRPWLHILGVKKGKEKASYFKIADLMLNPGLVGLHIVDAFCAGIVLCTTKGAMHSPEISYLSNGKNGIMTNDSVKAYSTSILDLISQPEKLSRIKRSALSDSNLYTLDNMVKNYVAGIKQCLEKNT